MTTTKKPTKKQLSRKAKLKAGVAILLAIALGGIVAVAVIDPLNNVQNQVGSLAPNTATGKNVCSGGNGGACDRVCISTSARQEFVDADTGTVLHIYARCHPSRITSIPGVEHSKGARKFVVIVPRGAKAPVLVTPSPNNSSNSNNHHQSTSPTHTTPSRPQGGGTGNNGGGGSSGGGGKDPVNNAVDQVQTTIDNIVNGVQNTGCTLAPMLCKQP
jgi:hypothetical protein